MTIDDRVVLLDVDGNPIGAADRLSVHTVDTPLHAAFSCLVVDDGTMLMTRRALSKRTWPGVWTGSFCGHPRPGESNEDAVHRYAERELGLTVTDLRCVLPDFRYRAVDAGGIVENEICPVFTARSVGVISPNRDEVGEHVWADVDDVREATRRCPWAFSPWLVEQLRDIPEIELRR